ncbi:O-antigen ligase family protein [Leptolyngbya sp. FACHB-261]|uniref:O-antigen ligase family protein n=1 Tax=Leptolyngbya sp. FACHB-261 TaxID=2692806 RepID=UPI001683AF01|nr:O-antigen ligase family protein [Leptolyngbya sp. FACHB-261]
MAKEPTSPPLSWKGQLLGLLAALIGVLFTLVPDSHSKLASWPWVFLFQVGLFCLAGWGLWMLLQDRPWRRLGSGLDWAAGLWAVALLLSMALAIYPGQARFYTLSACCYLIGLYTLVNWLETPQRRLQLGIAQGYVHVAFLVLSLGLWGATTLLPELNRLASLRPYGVDLPFDFGVVDLRNWAPLGHQNYVAGYLILALPLLAALAVLRSGQQRWLWWSGLVLGLVVLYTTSSRGGLLGLALLLLLSVALLPLSQRRRWLGVGAIAVLLTALLALNNRLQLLLGGLLTGQVQGETAYRLLTAQVGAALGLRQPLTGAGPGAVLLLFQRYRPSWAGREAEMAYQLHSTPVQLWADLGLLGSVAALITLVLVLRTVGQLWRLTENTDKVLAGSALGGLLAYVGFSLTDYQLDHPALAVPLLLNLALLISLLPGPPVAGRWRRAAAGGVSVALLLGVVWLVPVDRAWQLSSQGFAALSGRQVAAFVPALEQASALAPWEPYYPSQLGWNLVEQGQPEAGKRWFERAVQVAPDLEFGHSNLAWLKLSTGDPAGATQHFKRSAQLVPAKRGVFYGLAMSLLAQRRTDLAVRALTLEVLRDPVFATSPLWQTPLLQPLYAPVTAALDEACAELRLAQPQAESLKTFLDQVQLGLHWWLGERDVHSQTVQSVAPLMQKVLALAQGQTVEVRTPQTAGEALLAAWLNPQERERFLQQAWSRAVGLPPRPEDLAPLLQGLAASQSFDQWVKEKAPIRQYRRERSGFGVLSRHIDGPIPDDFLQVVDNVIMTNYLNELLPTSPFYLPELDRALQPWRDELLAKL